MKLSAEQRRQLRDLWEGCVEPEHAAGMVGADVDAVIAYFDRLESGDFGEGA